jgi:hypothetical protein
MDTNAFYSTASGLCFTLLGFWWVVVQFRHDELTSDGPRRLMAFVVSLHFVIPGIMSLASLLAGDNGVLWRIAFASAGVLGLAAVVIAGRSGVPGATGALAMVQRYEWFVAQLYIALTAVALAPEIARQGLGLQPLQVEGYVLTTIVLLGILFAWALFTEPVTEPHDRDAEAH